MMACPYPETYRDQVSGKTESNSLYLAWHAGYEAHKLEMANQSLKLANLAVELEAKIKKVMELKRELEKQKDQY
jgi:replicative DNA helicase